MNAFWKNRSIFITGATGFIGAHLVSALLSEQANIICLERNTTRQNSLDLFNIRPQVKVINGSIEDIVLLEKILVDYKIDTVFHLAAQSLFGTANHSPLSTFETNIRGTYNLFEACRRNYNIKRIVAVSSVTAYGNHLILPIREEFCLGAKSPYDASKACADVIAQSFAHSYKLPLTIVRSANVYGAGDLNFSRIIPGTILSILKNQNPVIRSDGSPIREFIFVEDVVKALMLLAEKIEKAGGEAYNVGSGEPLKIIEVVNQILELTGKSKNLKAEFSKRNINTNEIDATYLSSEKIKNQFDWKPEFDLKRGLLKTIDWYQNNLDSFF